MTELYKLVLLCVYDFSTQFLQVIKNYKPTIFYSKVSKSYAGLSIFGNSYQFTDLLNGLVDFISYVFGNV